MYNYSPLDDGRSGVEYVVFIHETTCSSSINLLVVITPQLGKLEMGHINIFQSL
jgi:hypothetical protein